MSEVIFYWWKILVEGLYFFMPAFVANMMPVVVMDLGGFRFLARPISISVLGSHKTYRGFVVGVLGAFVVVVLQIFISGFGFISGYEIFDYGFNLSSFLLAFLLGFGALFGDAVKSFFKRLLKKKPGSMWFPFDQIDFVLGGMLLAFFLTGALWEHLLVLLIVTPFLHLFVNFFAYKLRLKDVPW